MKISKASAYALHALMYMVRHLTQLPVTVEIMAQAEGMPVGYLGKIFQQLVHAGIVRSVRGRKRGYTFARPPEEITLMELLNALERQPLFEDCPLRHCLCGGTPENCRIYAQWVSGTRKLKDIFEETTIAAVAWNHPDHRFHERPQDLKPPKLEIRSIPGKQRTPSEESTKLG
jgi:Rrf2 family protein